MANAKKSPGAAPDIEGVGHGDSIEERCFSAALICLEGHFTHSPPMGTKSAAKVFAMVAKTLEKTHTLRRVRETLSRNVEIWIWLTRILAASVPTLTARSVGPLSSLNDPDKGVSSQESTALIVINFATIKEDLTILTKLMHISRNLLVNAEPQVPQDISAAVHFDQMVYQTVILCVNVTSKGYDGEVMDESHRLKLAEITELYKKLLVTSLQQAHNWTAKHDRNKMSFWFDVLLDDDSTLTGHDESLADCSGFRPEIAKQQVQHWLDRNSRMCDTARKLLRNYAANHADKPPGNLAPIRPLAWNWLPESSFDLAPDRHAGDAKTISVWNPDETDKFEQDRAYGRVSREIDMWWLKSRDPNYEEWVVGMPSVESAQARTEHCKTHLVQRYSHSFRDDNSVAPDGVDDELSQHERCPKCHGCHHDEYESDEHENEVEFGNEHQYEHEHNHNQEHNHEHNHQYNHDCYHGRQHNHNHHDHEYEHDHDCQHHHHHCHHHHEYAHDYVDDILDEEDADDDDSYEDGPLTGLLTEVPNILDPKQIEALHMIIKSCIFNSSGSGASRTGAGENLQKTRCRMFLALDCGKNLLRELLVFIAVWDKDEESLIFQVTTQIIEAIHDNALIPYTWNTLRISKDIISPAQTVLLRLVNHMLSGRSMSNLPAGESREAPQDLKLVHFFFSSFRNRIVPECAALMHLQAQIRHGKCDVSEFPVDTWDMERAKDGLGQYLEFLKTVAEMPEMRAKLIEWEAVYDLITVLSGIEAAVPKKPLVTQAVSKRNAGPAGDGMVERPYATGADGLAAAAAATAAACSSSPPLQEPAHKFPWAGVKSQLFMILATLLQPPPDRHSPGNPEVQMQMVKYNGIAPLLSSTAYDDYNPYAKERVTICLKWLLDGSDEANHFIRALSRAAPEPNLKPPETAGGTVASTLRIDGVEGDVKIQVRSNEPRVVRETLALVGDRRGQSAEQSGVTATVVSLEEDFMA